MHFGRLALFSALVICCLSACSSNSTPAGNSAPSCEAPRTTCGESCTDTSVDPLNCGACGTACPTGQGCVSGKCACPTATPDACGEGNAAFCTSFKRDSDNCGACGTVCAAGTRCIDGKCGCPKARPDACGMGDDAFCTDLKADAQNCGACGTACPGGTSCVAGKCTCPADRPDGCGTGTQLTCTSFAADAQNCGACGNACPSGQSCVAGKCSCTGTTPDACGTGAALFCTSLQADAQNCGTCGTACPGGQVCNGGKCDLTCASLTPDRCNVNAQVYCADLQTDARNCGSCGNACGASQSCSAGKCVCPSGTPDSCGTGASATCTNLQSDAMNCGTCGKACPSGQGCTAGVCGCPALAPDACTDATGATVCTSLKTDPQNCSACGKACAKGQACVNGACACPPQQPDYCQGFPVPPPGQPTPYCADLKTDNGNCGGCGRICKGPQVCQNGTCACPNNGTFCGPAGCVDIQTDGNNCGGCGKVCAAGQLCESGVCSATCRPGFAACPPSAPQDPALLAWWPLERDLSDVSGYGNKATPGAQLTFGNGVAGNALTSGSGLAPHIPLDRRSFSLEVWVKATDLTGDRIILGQCDGPTTGACLHFNVRGGHAYLGFGGDDLQGMATLSTGTWYHIAATFNAANKEKRLYVNGRLDGLRAGGDYSGTSGLTGIASGLPFGTPFAGAIDELKVYGVVRSPQEIAADAAVASNRCAFVGTGDANNCGACSNVCPEGGACAQGNCVCPGGGSVCGIGAWAACRNTMSDARNCGGCGATCVQGTQQCVNGSCGASPLFGFWRFDGNLSPTAGSQTLAVGSGGAIFAPGYNGWGTSKALDVKSANNAVALAQSPNLAASFTIEAWVQAPSFAGSTDYFLWATCSAFAQDKCLHLVVRNGRPYFGFYADDLSGSTTLSPNTWYHLAFSYDANTKRKTIYVNGRLDATNVGLANLNTGTASTLVGTPPAGLPGTTLEFIDDLRVYTAVRSPQDILDDATLLAAYSFEGINSPSIPDVGPNAIPGNLNPGQNTVAGPFGKAVSLDGVGQVFATYLPRLAQNVPFSVSMWVKPAGAGVILTESQQVNSTNGWIDAWSDVDANGNLHWMIWQCPSLNGGNIHFDAWSHLAMTYDLATLRVYLNGAEVANGPCKRTSPSTAGVTPYYSVGAQGLTVPAGGSTARFKGLLDEVRFYTRTLDPKEVAIEATK